MVKIFGDLRIEDDYTHELGPEPNFNESMYFNFFDPGRGLGGFVRIGNRANERRAEMTATLFLPDGRVLFNFKRPTIEDNSEFDAGGMRFDVLEPGERLRTLYEGSVVELVDPRAMSDPRKAFAESPKRGVALDLEHTAVGPMYGSAHDEHEASVSHQNQFARAHYEQHMRVRGTLDLDGERVEIDGHGLRDHSWGPRTWQAIEGYEWLTMNFGDDLGAMVSIIRRSGSEPRVGGVVVRGMEADFVEDASIDAEYEDDGLFHKALRVNLETRGGDRLEIEGTVRSFIPLRNRREGMTTHVGEGMTEWRLGNRTGFGLSEFLRQF
jgi:hypothetical protein